MPTRVDLHVHSKYSDRPSEWILRRLGAPESFTEPVEVYRRCRARGMSFVTISDHNRIDGALAIAHLPGTFLSSEITTYFPEDDAKVHCLVTGVTEAQFAQIQRLRENIYDFRRYLLEEDIVYSLAHPLFRVNDRLGVDHVEKLLVLFNRFEGINGTRDPRAAELVNAIFRNLTPELIERMADRHGLEPIGVTPWVKCFTGGSDDHGGVYIASAYTQTPDAADVTQFLDHLRRGDHEMGGASGTSVKLAHSFYHIAYSYYRSRFGGEGSGKPNLISELFRRMLERSEPPAAPSLRQRARRFLGRIATAKRWRKLSAIERTLVEEFSKLIRNMEHPADVSGDPAISDQQTFEIAGAICHKLGFTFLRKFLDHARRGDMIESLQTLAAVAPVAMSFSPYLAAMATQHKDEAFLQDVAERFNAAAHLRFRSDKRAWVTDTYADVNGVARTIQALAARAKRHDKSLTVVTCLPTEPRAAFDLKNFAPVGEFTLPEYENQKLAVPPFLEMLEYLERERFNEIIISTPGPMGLTALAAGKLLGLRLTGIYHTDFPMYVRHLTQDPGLEGLTEKFMLWFYDQMDQVFSPSDHYRRVLIEGGIEPAKVRVLRRGIDLEQFSPDRRSAKFWARHGLGEGFKFLYVGRISEEKNIRRLLRDFDTLVSQDVDAQLAIVGDGPLLRDLAKEHRRPGLVFTGTLVGEELARAFASADAFVFPSTTDTFGNVVLEAMASGLPAIVTDRGGPRETVRHLETGLIADYDRPGAFVEAMRKLATSPAEARILGAAARTDAMAYGWDQVLEELYRSSANRPGAKARPSSNHPLRSAALAPVELSVN